MNVTLVRYTQDPDELCGFAAGLCTGNEYGKTESALKGALSSGHASISEHASFTFLIE